MDCFENAYGFDEELAKGNWFTVKGIEVKLAYMNEPKVEAKVQDLRNKKSDQLGRSLTNEEHEEIGEEIFLNDILLDWKTKDNFECNLENKKIVKDKYPHFIVDCVAISSSNKEFQEKRLNETVGK